MTREEVADQLRAAGYDVQLVDWPNNSESENNGLGVWVCKSRVIHEDDRDSWVDLFRKVHPAAAKVYLLSWDEQGLPADWYAKIRYDVEPDPLHGKISVS